MHLRDIIVIKFDLSVCISQLVLQFGSVNGNLLFQIRSYRWLLLFKKYLLLSERDKAFWNSYFYASSRLILFWLRNKNRLVHPRVDNKLFLVLSRVLRAIYVSVLKQKLLHVVWLASCRELLVSLVVGKLALGKLDLVVFGLCSTLFGWWNLEFRVWLFVWILEFAKTLIRLLCIQPHLVSWSIVFALLLDSLDHNRTDGFFLSIYLVYNHLWYCNIFVSFRVAAWVFNRLGTQTKLLVY